MSMFNKVCQKNKKKKTWHNAVYKWFMLQVKRFIEIEKETGLCDCHTNIWCSQWLYEWKKNTNEQCHGNPSERTLKIVILTWIQIDRFKTTADDHNLTLQFTYICEAHSSFWLSLKWHATHVLQGQRIMLWLAAQFTRGATTLVPLVECVEASVCLWDTEKTE